MNHENDGFDPKKIIYIRFDKNDDWIPDNEMLAWLESFVNSMNDDYIPFGEPSLLEELEYLDQTVTGDHHPEALKMIMDAHNKFKEGSA